MSTRLRDVVMAALAEDMRPLVYTLREQGWDADIVASFDKGYLEMSIVVKLDWVPLPERDSLRSTEQDGSG